MIQENYAVIGDIHGRFDLLEDLLKQVDEKYPDHLLVFLGDMIDRGPDSFKVVQKVKELVEAGRAKAVAGNHEDMALDYARNPDEGVGMYGHMHIWLRNGGFKTIESYGKAMKIYGKAHFHEAFKKSGHHAFIKSLPMYLESTKVWFSHAPVPRQQFRVREGDFRMNKAALLWSFPDMLEGRYEELHGKIAVCGHVHGLFDGKLEPRIYDHIIYADTGAGCAPHGRLSAIILTDHAESGYSTSFLQAIPAGIDEAMEQKYIDKLSDKGR